MELFRDIALAYSVVLLVVSVFILGVTLPSIIQESRVRNGLIAFRRLLLYTGGSIFLLALTALLILVIPLAIEAENFRLYMYALLMIFSTICLIAAVAKYKIYTFNFSDRQKDMHVKIENLERKEAATT